MKPKKQMFEESTRQLLDQVNNMSLPAMQRIQAKNFVLLFRDAFKSDDVKRATFSQTIGDDYQMFPYDSYGFCKASSCAFVSLMPPRAWRVMYIDDLWTYGPHYYVQNVATGQILDMTFDQYKYDGVAVPYHMGRPVKIDAEARNTAVRFLHAVGLDFSALLNNNEKV